MLCTQSFASLLWILSESRVGRLWRTHDQHTSAVVDPTWPHGVCWDQPWDTMSIFFWALLLCSYTSALGDPRWPHGVYCVEINVETQRSYFLRVSIHSYSNEDVYYFFAHNLSLPCCVPCVLVKTEWDDRDGLTINTHLHWAIQRGNMACVLIFLRASLVQGYNN